MLVICEGASEENYIRELNKFFRENTVDIILHPEPVGSGVYSQVYKKYKEVKRGNKHQKIIIWVDWDIYKRDGSQLVAYEEKPKSVPDFKFNYCNYEDILVLHKSLNVIRDWESVCIRYNHFEVPMTNNIYMPLFLEKIFSTYRKGDFPIEPLSVEILSLLFRNNNDRSIKFHSDFISFIQNLLEDSGFNI